MTAPRPKSLPASLSDLELRWPALLSEIMNEIRSPEPPADLIQRFRQDKAFMNLVRGWENMPHPFPGQRLEHDPGPAVGSGPGHAAVLRPLR